MLVKMHFSLSNSYSNHHASYHVMPTIELKEAFFAFLSYEFKPQYQLMSSFIFSTQSLSYFKFSWKDLSSVNSFESAEVV